MLKWFSKLFDNPDLVQPVFPADSFSIFSLDLPDGPALVTVNKAYSGYLNKKYFPFCVQIEIELISMNPNGHPTDDEATVLYDLENKIAGFLKTYNKVHFIARVNRKGYRDLIYFINEPNFNGAELEYFLNRINKIRKIDFIVDEDPDWGQVDEILT